MDQGSEDIIPVELAATLDGLFRERVRRSPEAVAYVHYDKAGDRWVSQSWRAMASEVARWQQALQSEGLQAGDRVAIQLRNCPDWVAFHIAALSLGLVVVPLYVEDRPDNAAYILDDTYCRLLLVQSDSHWQRLREVLETMGHLRRVLILEGGLPVEADPRLVVVADWLPATATGLGPHSHTGQDLAAIFYTSGTTGRPKGVMLSHHNILSVTHAVLTMIDVYQEDVFLSFLPLSHTLESMGGYCLPMMAGATVAYSRSVAQLADDLQKIRPTVLIAVPRIFERFYGRIMEQLQQGGAVRRLVFNLAVEIGWRRFEYQQGRRHWSPLLWLWPVLDRLVAGKVLARLGGRLRAAVSGGAACPVSVARTFIGLGLPLLQGYGLTETSPVIGVNTFEDNDPASVGVPIRGTEVRIGQDDELLVRGPGVMLGYWNNHAATRQMIDAEGWLHTGDQARIEHGHIYITGRLKDILVLSNGENVPPADMEAAIMLDPLFEQALVIGEGRPFLAVLVVPEAQAWVGLVRDLGLDPFDRSVLQDERVEREILQRIQALLHDFPGYAKVRRVALTLEPWTLEAGLATPTMKIKRHKVMEFYRDEIARLYAGR